jgi:HK97 family phage prohead protease
MLINQTLSLSDCDIKFASVEGAFSGYGSVFGNVDSKNDIIMPGAYAEVLKSADRLPVYVNHGWLRDALPVGQWSGLKEDDRGLHGQANLVMQMPSAIDAYWGMKSGLVTGLSVAILPDAKATERRADGIRVIHRIKALKEISIVTEPANDAARVTDVKAADEIEQIETIRDFERFLRDAGSLTKGATEALVARAKMIFGRGEPDQQEIDAKAMSDLHAVLRRLKARIPL